MPNNSFKPTPCRGIGHVLYATLAHVRRPATGRLNSGVRRSPTMTTSLAAILSIITGLVGALIGHLLSERKSRKDDLAKMRLDAYSDFIRLTSHLVSARRIGRVQDDLQELGALNDAKARICICAETPVVDALEKFWLQGGTLEKEQEILAFTNLCRAMRTSLGRDKLPLDTRLSDIIFKLEPSTYSYRASGKNA